MNLSLLLQRLNSANESTRGRSFDRPQPYGSALQRRDSSASSVRSMIDDRMRWAEEERGRSRPATPVQAPSPFRSGSPFETEFSESRWQNAGMELVDAAATRGTQWHSRNDSPPPPPPEPGLYSGMNEWCQRCKTGVWRNGGPAPCDGTKGGCFNCAKAGVLCSRSGIKRALQRVSRRYNEDARYPCLYCAQMLRGRSRLKLHILGEHQCAYCENDEPFEDWTALYQHLNKEHWCQDCSLYMSKDALASHNHVPSSAEVCVTIEGEKGPLTDAPAHKDEGQARLASRTPSFSPPYMRPSARRSPAPAPKPSQRSTASAYLSDYTAPYACEHPGCGWSFTEKFAFKVHMQWFHLKFGDVEGDIAQPPSADPASDGAVPRLLPAASQGSDVSAPESENVSQSSQTSEQEAERGRKRRRSSPGVARPEHACEICGKTFARRTLRDNHLRTHTNERPFACSQPGCEQTFKQKNEQTRHQRTAHGEKEFVCGGILDSGRQWGCGKAFARSDGLLEHQTKTEKGRRCVRQWDGG